MNIRKGGGGVKRPRKMLVFGHNFLRRNSLLDIWQNVDSVRKNGGREVKKDCFVHIFRKTLIIMDGPLMRINI